MKALTIHNNHQTDWDFCWGVEGEIAVPTPAGFLCDRLDCGCDRSHGGLNSHKASTTLMVLDLDLDDIVTTSCGRSPGPAGDRVKVVMQGTHPRQVRSFPRCVPLPRRRPHATSRLSTVSDRCKTRCPLDPP
jgi:hypothetical protein